MPAVCREMVLLWCVLFEPPELLAPFRSCSRPRNVSRQTP